MEPVNRSRPILVGVDGSRGSLAAVDWAAAEAASRRSSLRVIHAFDWPLYSYGPGGPSSYGPPDADLRAAAGRILDEAVRRAALGSPGLSVDGTVRIGRPCPVMLDEARTAELVVVGSRGLGGFTGLLVGSVSSRLAAHAPCPVVVMRPAHALRGAGVGPPADCVVGVDDPSTAEDVVGFAFAEASRLHAGLTAVHCVEQLPARYGVPPDDGDEPVALRHQLSDTVDAWQGKYPEVAAETVLVSGSPGRVLTELSRKALLVVVGSRERGGFRELLLGSVSQQVLHHAHAPVAIVHQATLERTR
jgi:nucleotide-binding universal stress UspA family protein